MIKYRPQRGSLEESVEEMQVFNSKEEMFASIVNDWSGFISYDDLSITKDESDRFWLLFFFVLKFRGHRMIRS